MQDINIFEYATKNKVRFPFKGLISVEELWDLSLINLDSVYKSLNKLKKESDEESLLDVKSVKDIELDVQIEIIKYIVEYKLKEKAARELAAENRKKKQRILEIKAQREDKALENLSDEELDKMLDEL